MNLEEERLRRCRLSENYYRAVTWVNNSDAILVALSMALGVAGVGLLSTIIAAPVVIILESLSLCTGVHYYLPVLKVTSVPLQGLSLYSVM